MKYSAPYGVSDPDAHYINGNPQTGVQGSIPPASAFEEPQRELVNFIVQSNLNPDDGDLYQLTKAIRSQYVNVTRDIGTVANAIVCMLSPPLQSYTLGLPLQVIVARTNTGNATIDAGPGIAQIVRPDGSVLQAGDLSAGGIATLVFDGTRFQMLNFLGATSGGSNTYFVKIPYVADTSSVSNAITAVFTPAITTVAPGDAVLVKLANPITGATTIKVNGLAAAPVTKPDQSPLTSGDGAVGQIMLLIWDGLRWQFSNLKYATLKTGFQLYAARGTYSFVVPPNVFRLTSVRIWGSGGGGGSGYPYGTTGPTGGGGGGAGGYSEIKGLDVVPGQTIPIIIGAGGAGTPAYNWSTGGSGGASSFGSFCSATGGTGGTNGYPSTLGNGGSPGVGSGGNINYQGAFGSPGLPCTPMIVYSGGGSGGSAPMIGVESVGGYSLYDTGGNGAGGAGGEAFVSGYYSSTRGADGGDGRCEIDWRL
jgi:hypothetical protein